MTAELRRAGGIFVLGTLALLAPALDALTSPALAAAGAVVPFAVLSVVALISTDGRLFEWFARADERDRGRLYGLTSFSLTVTALGVLLVAVDLPIAAFVAAVFVLTTGDLGRTFVSTRTPDLVVATAAFVVCGTIGGSAAIVVAGLLGASAPPASLAVFVAASGALLGALIRSGLFLRDDSLVLLSSGLLVWFLLGLDLAPSPERVVVGLLLTLALGYVAFALGTASVTGMLTGVLLALFAVVLGGYGWFALLVTFFGLGGLSSKYRYEEKLARGIAEDNDGARGSGNVLANSAVALVAVVAYAASDHAGFDPALFRFAFAGAVAAALADTFSSEFGGLFDDPLLVTTFETVDPGTDGGVTWQGIVAGTVGAALIALLGGYFFDFDTLAVAIVLAAGVVGMLVDSVLGATLEGERLDNQGVNLLATLSAGLFAAVAVALT